MRSVPDFFPIRQRLPVEIGLAHTPVLRFPRAPASSQASRRIYGAPDVKCLPMPMLCHADHVADYFGGGQPSDQAIDRDFEREVLAAFIRIQPGVAVQLILAGFTVTT